MVGRGVGSAVGSAVGGFGWQQQSTVDESLQSQSPLLKSHIAPEVAEESLDHLRATINAQKRRLRRCRSGGTVDEDELVKETLRDHPPEERGTRAEWARRTGWHRREDTRRRAV